MLRHLLKVRKQAVNTTVNVYAKTTRKVNTPDVVDDNYKIYTDPGKMMTSRTTSSTKTYTPFSVDAEALYQQRTPYSVCVTLALPATLKDDEKRDNVCRPRRSSLH